MTEQQEKAVTGVVIRDGYPTLTRHIKQGDQLLYTSPPSVEALNRRAKACLNACDGVELEWLEGGLSGCVQGLREDRDNWQKQAWEAQAERNSLRTTNAAQAEQLARANMGYEPNGPIDMALSFLEGALGCKGFIWDFDQHEAATQTLADARTKLQSTPPEPQAGVELTNLPLAYAVLEREMMKHIGTQLEMTPPTFTTSDAAQQFIKDHLDEAYDQGFEPDDLVAFPLYGEPLSAAQGVPEGLIDALNEAAETLAGDRELRLPLIDELGGFACMLSAAPEQAESKEGK